MREMEKKVETILKGLALMAILFLPFNDFPYFSGLFHEMSVELSFYPLLIALPLFIFLSLFKKSLVFPKNISFFLFSAFILWVLLSTGINLPEFYALTFKGRYGLEKAVFQTMIFFFGFSVSILYYNLIFNYKILSKEDVFKSIAFSAVLILFYSFFEIFAVLKYWINPIYEFVGNYLHRYPEYPQRLRLFAGEASWLGIMLTFMYPFIYSTAFFEKKIFKINPFLFNFIFLFIVVLSYSRAVYITFAASIIGTSCLALYLGEGEIKKRAVKALVFFVFCLLLINSFAPSFEFSAGGKMKNPVFQVFRSPVAGGDDKIYGESNNDRTATQKTGLNMGLDNMFFGVGLGAYGFYFAKYLPPEFAGGSVIKKYLDPADKLWPHENGLYARIFAETGIPGLIIWFFFVISGLLLFLRVLKKKKFSFYSDEYFFAFSIFIAFCSVNIIGIVSGTLRHFQYWIVYGIFWGLLDFYQKEYSQTVKKNGI